MPPAPPKYVSTALNSASGLSRCYVNNERAQRWLTDALGLVTDDNEHRIGAFTVDFCWATQRWFVKA